MFRKLSRWILWLWGWKVDIAVPDYPKSIICVAPHTSNWDFVMGKLAYASVGRKAGFLMKSTWFFFPLGIFFRAIGGVPVPRGKKKTGLLVAYMVDRFKRAGQLNVAITPEGTRSRTANWHTGFLRIAYEADVPVLLGAIDYSTKRIYIVKKLDVTGDIEADIKAVKQYYKGFTGKIPSNFTTE